MALPNTYKQVVYIQSTATNPGTDNSSGQLIDTLVTPTPNTKILIDMSFDDLTVQSRLFGVNDTNSSYLTFVSYINGNSKWARVFKNGEGNWVSSEVAVDKNRHIFELDKDGYRIYTNGSKVYDAGNSATPTKNARHTLPLLCLFNFTTNNYGAHSSAKLYSCKIWDNGTLVRDMVPVIRKSDNKPGMYDLVNDVFYTNAGTGEFTYKEYAESGKITHIYLGTNLIRPAPSEITEEFNLNSTTEVGIGKSGYKIKQIMYEESYNYSQSAWYIAGLRTYVKGDNTQPSIYCDNYTGGTYGYDYGYGLGKYGGVVVRAQNSTESSQVSIVKINAGVTTSGKGAFKIIFTRDSVEYHYGQTAGSWTQEGTATLNSTVSGYVNTLFNNGNIYVNEGTWGGPTFTAKVTVTYEPV